MLRSIAVACFVCCLTATSVADTIGPVTLDFAPLGASHTNGSGTLAPADTSFGHYPMSVFGIENAIHRYDGTARLDDGPIAYCVLAIRDWEARFPHDPAIPREMLHLQRDYEHAGSAEGLDYARRLANWLQTDYAGTEFAALSRTELAKFSEKSAPEHPKGTPAPKARKEAAAEPVQSLRDPVPDARESAAEAREPAPEVREPAPAATPAPKPAKTPAFDVWSRFPKYVPPTTAP